MATTAICHSNSHFGRCPGDPDDLDAGRGWRTRDLTESLIDNFDPGILWDEYGIVADVVVRVLNHIWIPE